MSGIFGKLVRNSLFTWQNSMAFRIPANLKCQKPRVLKSSSTIEHLRKLSEKGILSTSPSSPVFPNNLLRFRFSGHGKNLKRYGSSFLGVLYSSHYFISFLSFLKTFVSDLWISAVNLQIYGFSIYGFLDNMSLFFHPDLGIYKIVCLDSGFLQ